MERCSSRCSGMSTARPVGERQLIPLNLLIAQRTRWRSTAAAASQRQQVYAFALGVLYAYWLEKSKSVVAPIIGHNFSDVVEYLILFALLGVF